jgi:hypothetical protein
LHSAADPQPKNAQNGTADDADMRGFSVLNPRNQRHPRLIPLEKACFESKLLQVCNADDPDRQEGRKPSVATALDVYPLSTSASTWATRMRSSVVSG